MGPFSHCSLARVPDKPNAYNKSLLPLQRLCPLPLAQPHPYGAREWPAFDPRFFA